MQTVEVGALKAQKHLGDRWLVAGGGNVGLFGKANSLEEWDSCGVADQGCESPFSWKNQHQEIQAPKNVQRKQFNPKFC